MEECINEMPSIPETLSILNLDSNSDQGSLKLFKKYDSECSINTPSTLLH